MSNIPVTFDREAYDQAKEEFAQWQYSRQEAHDKGLVTTCEMQYEPDPVDFMNLPKRTRRGPC